jgi:hypothetical protein
VDKKIRELFGWAGQSGEIASNVYLEESIKSAAKLMAPDQTPPPYDPSIWNQAEEKLKKEKIKLLQQNAPLWASNSSPPHELNC